MTEKYQKQIIAICKILWAVGFASLYALGGIDHSFIRRILAPLWLGMGLMAFSGGDWRVLIQVPLLMASLRLGYGADVFWTKVLRRGIYGLANGATASIHLLIRHAFLILAIHVLLCGLVSVLFGVFNPLDSARDEELVIGFIIGFLPLFMVQKRR